MSTERGEVRFRAGERIVRDAEGNETIWSPDSEDEGNEVEPDDDGEDEVEPDDDELFGDDEDDDLPDDDQEDVESD
jgi:hypothetical protein